MSDVAELVRTLSCVLFLSDISPSHHLSSKSMKVVRFLGHPGALVRFSVDMENEELFRAALPELKREGNALMRGGAIYAEISDQALQLLQQNPIPCSLTGKRDALLRHVSGWLKKAKELGWGRDVHYEGERYLGPEAGMIVQMREGAERKLEDVRGVTFSGNGSYLEATKGKETLLLFTQSAIRHLGLR